MNFSFAEGMKIKEVIKGNSGDYICGFHCGLARTYNKIISSYAVLYNIEN